MSINLIQIIKKLLKNKTVRRFLSLTGSALACATTGIALKEQIGNQKSIKEYEVYTMEETAHLLKIREDELLEILENGEIQYRNFGSRQRVLGKNLLDYLGR